MRGAERLSGKECKEPTDDSGDELAGWLALATSEVLRGGSTMFPSFSLPLRNEFFSVASVAADELWPATDGGAGNAAWAICVIGGPVRKGEGFADDAEDIWGDSESPRRGY